MKGFVTLRIGGKGLDIQEINNKLGRPCSFSYNIGDVYEDKYSGKRIIREEDCWLVDVENKENKTLEECIEQFISGFYHAADYLKALASKFDVLVWISAYPEEEQSNVHLSEKTIRAINEIGASVDVNSMFLKEFYDGTYKENKLYNRGGNASANGIKELIEKELSVIVGERIRQFRRAALMLGVDFGDDVELECATSAGQREVSLAPQFSLHIHSSWRLLKDDDICLSQSALFNHMNGFKWCEGWDGETDTELFSDISARLNETFQSSSVRVTSIVANELGDLKVYMENNYCLELFVDSIGNAESWRFFKKDDDSSHLVIFDEE